MPRTGRPPIDISGQTFGFFTVTSDSRNPPGGSGTEWRCICECGTERWIAGHRLRKGRVKHCGCKTPPKMRDLGGRPFGKWTVVGTYRRGVNGGRPAIFWPCRCECGTERDVLAGSLTSGKSIDCGCGRNEKVGKRSYKHGRSADRIHVRWLGMIQRCEQKTHKGYHNYGGRGICVCARWHTFVEFIVDMGDPPTPKHVIDRIDNDAHYSCGKCEECLANGWTANCRWVTSKESANNTRKNRILEIDGVRLTVSQWAERLAVSPQLLQARRKLGWSDAEILTTPIVPKDARTPEMKRRRRDALAKRDPSRGLLTLSAVPEVDEGTQS